MNTILVIIKKELKRFFTDRRMLISLILPGLLIFFVYSVMGEYVGDLGTGTEEYNVGIVNNQEELNSFNSVDGWVEDNEFTYPQDSEKSVFMDATTFLSDKDAILSSNLK